MLDLLTATAVATVLAGLAALALVGLSIAPFVVATGLASRRGRSTARAGGLALAGVGAGLGLALAVLRSDLLAVLAVLPLVLCWAAPLALRVAGGGAGRVVGRQGQHER